MVFICRNDGNLTEATCHTERITNDLKLTPLDDVAAIGASTNAPGFPCPEQLLGEPRAWCKFDNWGFGDDPRDVKEPGFLSPEQLLGQPFAQYKSDSWGLGAIAVNMVLREPLFEGDSPRDVLRNIFKTLGRPSTMDSYVGGLLQQQNFEAFVITLRRCVFWGLVSSPRSYPHDLVHCSICIWDARRCLRWKFANASSFLTFCVAWHRVASLSLSNSPIPPLMCSQFLVPLFMSLPPEVVATGTPCAAFELRKFVHRTIETTVGD